MSYRVIASPLKPKYIVLLCICLWVSFSLTISFADTDKTIRYNPAEIETAWADWKTNYVTTQGAGPAPRQRVLGGVSTVSTVSEGQAYGILLASLFDEQALLDGLWLFASDHLNTTGLMHWHILQHNVVAGTGAATDSDVDMAMGMVIACRKLNNGDWPASTNGLDYCQIATDLINNIWEHEVDHPGIDPSAGLDDNPGYELLPGDMWSLKTEYPDGIVNLSYFAPAYFRVFAEFTGNSSWYSVIDRNYEIADLSKQIEGNCSTLVPNWSTYDGQYQYVPWHGVTSEYWGYDGARFAWRVALDNEWFNDPKAEQMINEIGGFFSSIDITNVRSEYRLSGTYVSGIRNPFFVANAASAIWSATDPIPSDCGQATGTLRTTPQQAYENTVNIGTRNYYNDSWRLLAMMLMTGNFPNPLTIGTDSPDTNRPIDMPSVTPSPELTVAPNLYLIAQVNDDTEQSTEFKYQITNLGREPQSDVSVRIFFNIDDMQVAEDYVLETYYDSSDNITISPPTQWEDDTYYFEVVYDTATLMAANSFEFHGVLRLVNWDTNFDSNNDWWRVGLSDDFVTTTNIPVYIADVLTIGQEPPSNRPEESTNIASVVPTLMYTPTNIVVPTVAVTSTQTVIEPTETSPPLPTVTNTPIPMPTQTSTPIPEDTGTDVSVLLQVRREGTDNNQQAQFRYQLQNTGNSTLSGLSARIYFDLDNSEPASNYVFETYYDSSSSAFVSGPYQVDTDTHYYDIAYGGALNAGATFEFTGALHLGNWGQTFSSANDWWNRTISSDYVVTTFIPVYVNGGLVFGQQP